MPKKATKGWRSILCLAGLGGAVLVAGCAGASSSPAAVQDRGRVADAATSVPTPGAIVNQATAAASSAGRESTVPSGSESAAAEATPAVAVGAKAATEEQLAPLDLPQTTAVYFRTRGRSRSDTLKAIVSSPTGEMLGSKFIQIESTSSVLVVYSPDTGEATVFHTYSSPSYSKRSKRPLTIDDRLYLETEYENGSLNIVEYNPGTLASRGSGDTELLRAAVIGDTHFYYKYPEYRGFLGYYGYLEFVKEPVSGGEATRRRLRPPDDYRDDPDFPFRLVAVGQDLYGVKTPFTEGDPIVIYRVDRSTGEPTRIATFPHRDPDRKGFPEPKFDNDMVYWALVNKSATSTVIQVWSYRLGDPATKLNITDIRVPSGGREASVFGFDVDDGHFVFTVRLKGDKTHQLLFYDEESKSISVSDPGLVVNYAQIIHFGEPGDATSSKPDTRTTTGAQPPPTPTPQAAAGSRDSTSSPPTPTIAMTPLARPTASSFDLEVSVTPHEFSVFRFCRALSADTSVCSREEQELDAKPEEFYTQEAWEAIRFSLKLAKRINHSKAAPEHLLYGLLGRTDGSAARLLSELGLDLPLVLSRLQEALLDMPWTSASSRELYPDVGNDLTPVVVEDAREQAARLNAELVSPEHLLVAILERGSSAGSRILKELGITRDLVWQALVRSRCP